MYDFIAYHPINTVFSTNLTNNTVNLNETFTLVCNADANPAASYRLYREQESLEEQSNGTYLTFVSTRTKQVAYKCIPFNSFGDGPSKLINVTVYCKYICCGLILLLVQFFFKPAHFFLTSLLFSNQEYNFKPAYLSTL